jgi:predicted patatin/cPLA2 family phospholipase
MATKFNSGDRVSFARNATTKSDSTVVSFVLPLATIDDAVQVYVIEYIDGWIPDALRINNYRLDGSKKYVFVSESELTKI